MFGIETEFIFKNGNGMLSELSDEEKRQRQRDVTRRHNSLQVPTENNRRKQLEKRGGLTSRQRRKKADAEKEQFLVQGLQAKVLVEAVRSFDINLANNVVTRVGVRKNK